MSDYRDRLATVFFTNLPSFPDAPCASEKNPDLFFPDPKDVRTIAVAKSVCGDCVYRLPCLEYALTHELEHGVFGGTTPEERKRIKPRRDKRWKTEQGGAA